MKIDIVINEKKKLHLLTADAGDSDGNSKSRIPKLISFSLFIKQVILNNLGDQNDIEDER